MPNRTMLMVAAVVAGTTILPPAVNAGLLPGFTLAAEDSIMIHEAWARASAGASTTAAAYVTLMGGDRPDTLTGVSTPIAATATLHETMSENGVMKMRPVQGVTVPARGMLTFAPGGYHVMLTGLKRPLVAGQTFPLTLMFEHAAPITVDVKVRPIGRGKSNDMMSHDHMHMQ